MANLQAIRPRSPLIWLLLGLRGRISRGVYWLAYVVLSCVQAAIIAQIIGGEAASAFRLASAVGPAVLLATLYSHLAISVKRLHDCGYTGLFALTLLVPLVNVGFTIWAGIVPGAKGPNRFGAANDRPPA